MVLLRKRSKLCLKVGLQYPYLKMGLRYYQLSRDISACVYGGTLKICFIEILCTLFYRYPTSEKNLLLFIIHRTKKKNQKTWDWYKDVRHF